MRLCPACGAQRALLPVAVGAMNIHDVRDIRQTDRRQTASLLNDPRLWGGGIVAASRLQLVNISLQ